MKAELQLFVSLCLLIGSFCPSVRQGGVWHCRRHRGGQLAAVRLRHLLPDQESANQHQVTPTARPDSAHLEAPAEHRKTNALEATKHSIHGLCLLMPVLMLAARLSELAVTS